MTNKRVYPPTAAWAVIHSNDGFEEDGCYIAIDHPIQYSSYEDLCEGLFEAVQRQNDDLCLSIELVDAETNEVRTHQIKAEPELFMEDEGEAVIVEWDDGYAFASVAFPVPDSEIN